jgi:hypothetical protein
MERLPVIAVTEPFPNKMNTIADERGICIELRTPFLYHRLPICFRGEKRDLVFVALPSVVVITEIIYKPVSKHFAALSVVLIITHNNI